MTFLDHWTCCLLSGSLDICRSFMEGLALFPTSASEDGCIVIHDPNDWSTTWPFSRCRKIPTLIILLLNQDILVPIWLAWMWSNCLGDKNQTQTWIVDKVCGLSTMTSSSSKWHSESLNCRGKFAILQESNDKYN